MSYYPIPTWTPLTAWADPLPPREDKKMDTKKNDDPGPDPGWDPYDPVTQLAHALVSWMPHNALAGVPRPHVEAFIATWSAEKRQVAHDWIVACQSPHSMAAFNPPEHIAALTASFGRVLPQKEPAPEKVNHPSHYGGEGNTYEAIKVIRAWSLGFTLGNAIKYIARAGKKKGETPLDDLKKARWYLDNEIQALEAAETKT